MADHSTDADVLDVLITDHREFTELIELITTTVDPAQRRELADQLIGELVRHSVAEEMYVYPAMRDHLPDGKEAVEHDTQEHKELERLMKQLEGTDAEDAQFVQIVAEIREVLADHV